MGQDVPINRNRIASISWYNDCNVGALRRLLVLFHA
jgi:hypothetical protein